jgi:uncharacterized protein
VIQASVSLDYTTVLNVVFLALAALLVVRYFRRGGGLAMLRMMNTPMSEAGSVAATTSSHGAFRSMKPGMADLHP